MISARTLKTLALGASMLAALTLPSAAETLTMWSRAAAAGPAQGMIDLWNSTHEDKIELTVIPDQQVVTKLATAVQAGDVPDLMSFDLIFMPDFMKAGFLVDLTDLLANDPNQAKVGLFSLVLTIPAGYALARFPIPGKEYFFIFLLLALIIPYQALITPLFFMFATLKLTNTLFGLAIIHTAIHIPFSVYIMRNSFEAVPRELEEAAVIDGCSSWQVLLRIYLPAIRPAIVTVSLFAFVTSWNEFLAALVIMNRGSTFTLPLVLAAARQETSIGGTDWGLLQAGVTIAIIPCILFYLLLQKYYVSGFLSGAVK